MFCLCEGFVYGGGEMLDGERDQEGGREADG